MKEANLNGKKDSTALIVLLKNAKMGHAKTRLAKGIGDKEAYKAYLHLLAANRSLCESYSGSVYLFYSQTLPNKIDRWRLSNGHYHLQSEGDLGDRIQSAFATVLSLHSKAIIIGSDCPYITLDHLVETSHLLDASDVVFGPSLDGGYYLLGLKAVQSVLMQDMPWSTDQVLSISLDRCISAQLKVSQLQALEDIDEVDHWQRYLDSDQYQVYNSSISRLL